MGSLGVPKGFILGPLLLQSPRLFIRVIVKIDSAFVFVFEARISQFARIVLSTPVDYFSILLRALSDMGNFGFSDHSFNKENPGHGTIRKQ